MCMSKLVPASQNQSVHCKKNLLSIDSQWGARLSWNELTVGPFGCTLQSRMNPVIPVWWQYLRYWCHEMIFFSSTAVIFDELLWVGMHQYGTCTVSPNKNRYGMWYKGPYRTPLMILWGNITQATMRPWWHSLARYLRACDPDLISHTSWYFLLFMPRLSRTTNSAFWQHLCAQLT